MFDDYCNRCAALLYLAGLVLSEPYLEALGGGHALARLHHAHLARGQHHRPRHVALVLQTQLAGGVLHHRGGHLVVVGLVLHDNSISSVPRPAGWRSGLRRAT